MIWVQLVNGLMEGMMLFLIASGLTLIFGVSRIVNFAHGSLFMLGAFLTYALVPLIGTGTIWGFFASVVLAGLGTAAVGTIFEVVALRRVYGRDSLMQLLITVALVFIIRDVVRAIWGPNSLTVPTPDDLMGALLGSNEKIILTLAFGPIVAGLGGLVFGALCVRLTEIYFAMLTLACAQITFTVLFQWYDFTGGDTGINGFMPARFSLSEANFTTLVMVVLALCLALLARLVASQLGFAIRAVGQDRWRAEALGLAPRRVQLTVFVISATLAGVAGTLFAVFQGAAYPDYAGLGFTLDGLIMVVLGGLNSFWGGVLGAVVFSQLKHWAPLLTDKWNLLLGVVLLGIVIALPHGVAGVGSRLARMLGLETRK